MTDPRSSIKTLLDAELSSVDLTWDDDFTVLTWHVMYEPTILGLDRFFLDKQLDLIFTISDSVSTETVLGVSHRGHYRVTPFAIDKYDVNADKIITASLVLWKAVEELRRVFKENPWGSMRSLIEDKVEVHDFGDVQVWSKPCTVEYKTYSR